MDGTGTKGKELALVKRSALAWGPGLLLIGMAASSLWVRQRYHPGPIWPPAPMEIVPAILGLLLCLLFSAFHFPREGGGLERVWGLGFPLLRLFIPVYRKRIELRGLNGVFIEQRVLVFRKPFESRPYKQIIYAVGLLGGRPSLTLDDFKKYERARKLAEGLARGLNFPLKDGTSGKGFTREPGHLDEPVAKALHRKGQGGAAKRPDEILSRIRPGRGGTMITLPAMDFTLLHKTALALLVVAAALGLLLKNWSFLGFCVFAALVIFDNAIRKLTITASREGLKIVSKGLVPVWHSFPAKGLEEILLVPGPDPGEIPLKVEELPAWAEGLLRVFIAYKLSSRLVARSDQKTQYARLLVPREEAEYILQKILAALAA